MKEDHAVIYETPPNGGVWTVQTKTRTASFPWRIYVTLPERVFTEGEFTEYRQRALSDAINWAQDVADDHEII